jgi:hypothetical protein
MAAAVGDDGVPVPAHRAGAPVKSSIAKAPGEIHEGRRRHPALCKDADASSEQAVVRARTPVSAR